MLLDILLFALGLGLLLVGGDLLVRGATHLARGFNVSPVAIGMTVVAFGTSAPELVVSLLASSRGASGVAFGNVAGSNIANIGLILGLTALLSPLRVHRSIVTREIPMLILASLAVMALGSDAVLGGGTSRLDRGDGITLLLLFGVFLYYTVLDIRSGRSGDAFLEESSDVLPRRRVGPPVLLVVGGIGGLALGGYLLVGSAVAIARSLEVPEAAIGATLVAVGTSLPELATSLIAARRGAADLAVGNIVGSNLFNVLFVLSLSTTLAPFELPVGGVVDLAVGAVLALVLLPMATTQGRISRFEGAVLLGGYGAYVVWRLGAVHGG